MWIAIAFWLPSGCGIAVTPIYEFGLMSASEALTKFITRTLSGTLTVSIAPSRALTVSVLPSTFSISPRMRTGGCCASAVPMSATARPAPISVRCQCPILMTFLHA